ncbi:NADPH-dependent FMN reductase [Demequina sp.]|uniref:NADPH-dependent FMN reductase n=1 Tax=Demequina sp. TaxID=2050685 RepID=UPI003A85BD7B
MTTLGVLIGPLSSSRATRHVSRLLHEVVPSHVRLVELDPQGLPHHAPYTDVVPATTGVQWKRDVAQLDGLLVLTPCHERSIPGVLKNALDWAGGTVAPNALTGLPVVIAGMGCEAAARFSAIQHLRTVLTDAGAVLKSQPEMMLHVEDDSFDESGSCVDNALRGDAIELLSIAAGFVAHQTRAGIVRGHLAAVESSLVGDDSIVTQVLAAAPGPESPRLGVPTAPLPRPSVA